MGGRRREEDLGEKEDRPVEPGEVRVHGNDPEAVRINREGSGPDSDPGRRGTADPRGGESEASGKLREEREESEGPVDPGGGISGSARSPSEDREGSFGDVDVDGDTPGQQSGHDKGEDHVGSFGDIDR